MLKIIYFASLRERLGAEGETMPLPQGVVTVSDLIEHLVALHGEVWQQVLQNTKVMTAVNQEMCDLDQVLAESDEVAFFPPVTGG